MTAPSAAIFVPARKLGHTLILAIVVGVLLTPLPFIPAWQLVELRAFDYLSTLWPARPPEPGAVIVAIDEPSFAEFKRQWPWPRSLHGRLIETLRGAGAKAIGLDVIFAEPATDPEEDRKLAAAMGPDVLLAGEETVIETPQAVETIRVEPLPELLARGAHAGLASVSLDGDQVLRRLPEARDGFARRLAALSGSNTADSNGAALIQYFGPPRSYPTVSYYQALEPGTHLPAGYFQGKTVVIGLSLQNTVSAGKKQPDSFATSYTARNGLLSAGPEVQASILDNIVHGLFVRPVAPWLAALAAAAATLIAAFATHAAHPWRAAAIAAGELVLVFGLSYLALRFGRIWVPPLLPAAGITFAVAANVAQGYLSELAARRRITDAFGYYLAPPLVERLARDPTHLKLGGEVRTLTVLFCDIRGFTAISERLKNEPERLTLFVNRVLTQLSKAVLETGGTIDKYIGDCIMAFWNAPLDDPDHALHAVEAAIAMQRAAADLNREFAAESARDGRTPIEVAIGIGINTGNCVVGNMGSESRFDYTAVGDAVNVAARLEGLCKTYNVGILIGETTAKSLSGRIATRRVQTAVITGRDEAADIYTLA